MKNMDDKDINKYRLPPRKRMIEIPTDDGGRYEFDFCRPSLGDRNNFVIKWGLGNSKSPPKYEGDEAKLMEFNRDTIRLSITGGRMRDAEGKVTETFNLADDKDFDRLDNLVVDILAKEAQDGVNLSARDEYFRSKGSAEKA